jgi:hypothetical protein
VHVRWLSQGNDGLSGSWVVSLSWEACRIDMGEQL